MSSLNRPICVGMFVLLLPFVIIWGWWVRLDTSNECAVILISTSPVLLNSLYFKTMPVISVSSVKISRGGGFLEKEKPCCTKNLSQIFRQCHCLSVLFDSYCGLLKRECWRCWLKKWGGGLALCQSTVKWLGMNKEVHTKILQPAQPLSSVSSRRHGNHHSNTLCYPSVFGRIFTSIYLLEGHEISVSPFLFTRRFSFLSVCVCSVILHRISHAAKGPGPEAQMYNVM